MDNTYGDGKKECKKVFIDNVSFDTRDYMEEFLSVIKNNWDDLKKQQLYSLYFKNFDDYSKFIEKHLITETGQNGSRNEKDATVIVSGMISTIENRAEQLSKSKYAEQLWNLLNNISTDNSDI